MTSTYCVDVNSGSNSRWTLNYTVYQSVKVTNIYLLIYLLITLLLDYLLMGRWPASKTRSGLLPSYHQKGSPDEPDHDAMLDLSNTALSNYMVINGGFALPVWIHSCLAVSPGVRQEPQICNCMVFSHSVG